MKIELGHEELNDAITLWLEQKLFPGQQFTVDVKNCDGVSANSSPTRYTITANAIAITDD